MLFWIIDEEWNDYDVEKQEILKEFPNAEIKISNYKNYMQDLKKFGNKADAIIAQIYCDITKEVIESLENCKVISVYGGGYDRVDVQAASYKNIIVTNVQKYCAEDVSDYVIAAIFTINKRITEHNLVVREKVKNGIWDIVKNEPLKHRIKNSTLLVIGIGDIGSLVAKKALGLGMNVIGYDEFKSEKQLNELGIKKVAWEEGLKLADYVSINLKGCKENVEKMGYNDFKLMKRSAYIINTARGSILNEDDLIKAVNENLIEGAVLDVITVEPPQGDESIFQTENIYITPHMSYISLESLSDLKYLTIHNALSVIKGEHPRDQVN